MKRFMVCREHRRLSNVEALWQLHADLWHLINDYLKVRFHMFFRCFQELKQHPTLGTVQKHWSCCI
jgi:hypothetical protein